MPMNLLQQLGTLRLAIDPIGTVAVKAVLLAVGRMPIPSGPASWAATWA